MPGAGGDRHGSQEADIPALLARIDALERRQGPGHAPARGGPGGGASGGPSDRTAADIGGWRGPRGGTRGVKAESSANGGTRAKGRPGDWRCASCQAYPCFGRTHVCYQCGARRTGQSSDVAASRGRNDGGLSRAFGRGGYLGPIGAGGTRPLLGGRGNAAAGSADASVAPPLPKPPTVRVPGASLAAKAEADAGGARSARPRGGGGGAGADAGGFQVVRNGPPLVAASGAAAVSWPTRTRNSWAELAEEEDAMQQDDMDQVADDDSPEIGGDDGGDGGDPTGDDDDDAGDQGEGTAADDMDEQGLRRAWMDHCRACKVLEKDASMPAELVGNARALRDEAERRWRAARTPHPLSKRLRWAESDLRAAEEKEGAHRRELEVHLEATSRRTRELEARIEVDVARTARKRAVLQSILAESVPEGAAEREKVPMAVAATAVTGIKQSIAPPLVAAIERLSAPMEEGAAEGVRQELQLVAASLSTLEDLLRGAILPTVPLGSALHFDIGGGDDGDGGRAGGAAAGSDGGASATIATRWTKPTASEPWRKAAAAGPTAAAPANSASAAEEARRILRDHGAGATAAVGRPPVAKAADTNDLAEAAKREHQAAQVQFQQAQLQQQLQWDAQRLQQEELERQQRQVRQEEEKRLHLQAFERAAADRRAEEARQRELLVASMSPEDLARAAEVHAQQMAVGAQAFGSLAATNLAGLVHQEHAHSLAQGTAATASAAGQWDEGEVQHIMEMSAEELAQADGGHHGF